MKEVTMQKQTEKAKQRIQEFQEYGLTFYYLLQEKKISLKDLFYLFFSVDDEKSCFTYSKILRHIQKQDLVNAKDKGEKEYPNKKNLEEREYRIFLNCTYTKKLLNEILEQEPKVDRTLFHIYQNILEEQSK